MVEVSNTDNDMIAEQEPDTEFVDEEGRRYVAIAR